MKALLAALAILILPASSFATDNCFGALGGGFRLGVSRLGGSDPLQPVADKIAREIKRFVDDYPDRRKLGGENAPVWDDFETLKDRVEPLALVVRDLNASSIPRLQELLAKHPELSELRGRLLNETGPDFVKAENYGPTGFGLRQAFRKILFDLHAPIGLWFASALTPLPLDTNKEIQTRKAVEVVQHLEYDIAQIYHSSGYSTPQQIKQALPAGSHALRFAEGQMEFAMFRPVRARWWVDKVGFHNLFVTGLKRTGNEHDERDWVEAIRLGVPRDEFAQWDLDLKPKYGLAILPLQFFKWFDNSYGEDIYIFKKSRVQNRVTMSIGDSYDTLQVSRLNSELTPEKARPQLWSERFTPYKYRELIAPFVRENFSERARPAEEPLIPIRTNPNQYSRSFIELHYFGPMVLDDVEAFIFYRGGEPTGEFLRALLERKIRIYKINESDQTLVEWRAP